MNLSYRVLSPPWCCFGDARQAGQNPRPPYAELSSSSEPSVHVHYSFEAMTVLPSSVPLMLMPKHEKNVWTLGHSQWANVPLGFSIWDGETAIWKLASFKHCKLGSSAASGNISEHRSARDLNGSLIHILATYGSLWSGMLRISGGKSYSRI